MFLNTSLVRMKLVPTCRRGTGKKQGLGVEHSFPEAARAVTRSCCNTDNPSPCLNLFLPTLIPAMCQPFWLSSQLNAERGEVTPVSDTGKVVGLKERAS